MGAFQEAVGCTRRAWPGEGMGPLSFPAARQPVVKASCRSRACYCLPPDSPIPFYGHSCSLFPPFSSFMILEWLPMALRVVSSRRQAAQLFYISGVYLAKIYP